MSDDPFGLSVPPLGSELQVEYPEVSAFKALKKLIAEFEARLDDDHELGAYLNIREVPLYLRDVRLSDTLLLFEGVDRTGQDVLAIQHYGQLSLQLVKVKKLKERPARVGFLTSPT